MCGNQPPGHCLIMSPQIAPNKEKWSQLSSHRRASWDYSNLLCIRLSSLSWTSPDINRPLTLKLNKSQIIADTKLWPESRKMTKLKTDQLKNSLESFIDRRHIASSIHCGLQIHCKETLDSCECLTARVIEWLSSCINCLINTPTPCKWGHHLSLIDALHKL